MFHNPLQYRGLFIYLAISPCLIYVNTRELKGVSMKIASCALKGMLWRLSCVLMHGIHLTGDSATLLTRPLQVFTILRFLANFVYLMCIFLP